MPPAEEKFVMDNLPVRKRNRLKEYDYSANGTYFITICTKDMKCLLSTIVGGDDPGAPRVELLSYGKIADRNISIMNEIYSDISVDKYVIMPNHIHMLISVNNDNHQIGAPRSSPPTARIPAFIAAFKRFTGREIGCNIWQRNYHDHIIRDDDDFLVRWQYIDENPRKWIIGKDEYYL